MNNTLIKKLLPTLVILLLLILPCDGGNRTITFYENEDNLIPFEIISYEDNTIIFHLVKFINNSTCFEPRLTFRILYSNGTSNLITINNHDIPSYNFCVNMMLPVLNTIPGYILVIY